MKALIVCLFLSLAGAFHCFGSDDVKFFQRYNYTFLTEENGLPDNFIDDLLMDRQGYMWIATHKGLCRYDGYRTVTFDTHSAHIRLKSGFVRKLCQDAAGRLWVGTEAGLDLIDLTTYRSIDPLAVLGAEAGQLARTPVSTLFLDAQQRLWVATDKGLWCLGFDKEGKVSEWHSLKQSIVSPVHALADVEDTVCAGIDNNLYRLNASPEGHELQLQPLSEQIEPFSEDWRILCMTVWDGHLWVGTNRGLFDYDLQTFALTRYRYSNHREGMLSQAYITDLRLTGTGELIVSTLNGLNVFHRDTNTFEYIRHSGTASQQSLNNSAIDCLLTDGRSIWAGTQKGGVNLLTYRSLRVSQQTCPVNAIGEDSHGNLWMGVVEGGLNWVAKADGNITAFKFRKDDDHSLSNNTLSGLLIDRQDRLWAYTWGVGINMTDLNRPDMRFERLEREDSIGLESDFTSSACEDPTEGGIWFVTTRGLHYFDPVRHHFRQARFPDSDQEFEAVGTAMVDHKRRLWMPTSKGVFILDLHSFHYSPERLNYLYLKYRLSDPQSKQQERINCVLQTRNGTIWLGSDGNGLYRLVSEHEREFTFENYTVTDGLSDNNLLNMTEDGAGLIWITTGYGLSCLDPKQMTFTNYTKEDGLPGNQFQRNACFYSASRDRLYFGTTNGLVSFGPTLPEHLKNTDEPTRVHISYLSIDGTTLYPPSTIDSLHTPACPEQGLRLHEKDRNLLMECSTLDYGKLNRVRYAYRLKGYEEEWKKTRPGEHSIRYTRLPAGHYTLEVYATDDKGHWTEAVTRTDVTVRPYFYKTTGFGAGMLLLAAACGTGLWYRRRRRTRTARSVREDVPLPAGTEPTPPDTVVTEVAPAMESDREEPEATVPKETADLGALSKDKEFLDMAYGLMSRHYAEAEYGVDDFVHHLGYSKTFINNRLQALCGSSIGQFMKNYRLDVSKETIEKGNRQVSVTDLAFAVGFSDPKYFSRCFKERFGILPREMMKKLKDGSETEPIT